LQLQNHQFAYHNPSGNLGLHIEEEKLVFMFRARGLCFKREVHVNFSECIPKTAAEDGARITCGRVDFVCMGANLIVSIECQEYQHQRKGYEVGCDVARSFKIVEACRCAGSTATFIEINYNPHPCTIDGVLHEVHQERSLQRLGDLVEDLFKHHDNSSESGQFKMIYVNYDSAMEDGKMIPVICKDKVYPEMAKQCILLNITPDDYGPNCTPDVYGPHHRLAHILHCPIRDATPDAIPTKRKLGDMQEPRPRLTLQEHLYQSRGLDNCLSDCRLSVTGCNFKLLKRQEWIRLLTSYGAACTDGVSGKTTHLLVGPNPTAPWKVLRAQEMKIKIINEYDAFDLISTNQPTAQVRSIHEEEEWVRCDSCSKWRKVPSNYHFHRNQNFFCHMIPLMTCDVQEEEWDEKESVAELKGDATMP